MTARIAWMGVWWITAVVGAHMLAFAIVHLLPGPALSALGLAGAETSARSAFLAQHAQRAYAVVVSDLARGDLGRTLDGLAVNDELGRALCAGAPRLGAALAVVALTVLGVAFAPARRLPAIAAVAAALSFLPPFVAPFIGVGALLLLPATQWDAAGWSLSALAIAMPAAALAAAQAARITERNLGLQFATNLRALGYSRHRQRLRLLINLLVEMTPTLEKIALGLLSAALFAEALFGEDGVGALTLRAIRRNDTDLILAVVLLFAVATNTLRIVSELLRPRTAVLQR